MKVGEYYGTSCRLRSGSSEVNLVGRKIKGKGGRDGVVFMVDLLTELRCFGRLS
jgi:hypothetical protein